MTGTEKRNAFEESLTKAADDAIQIDPSAFVQYAVRKFPDMKIPVLSEHENLVKSFHALIQLGYAYDFLTLSIMDLIVDLNPKISTLALQRELRRTSRMAHDIVRAQISRAVAQGVPQEELDLLLEPAQPLKKMQKAKQNKRTH